MLVRPEQPADADAIYVVHATSFPTPPEARLVDALCEAGRLSCLFFSGLQPMHT